MSLSGLVLAVALGQAPVSMVIPEDATGKSVIAGDFANRALRVNCVTGCSGSSGLTNTELRASPVAVSGTFYQATQPISAASALAVTDNNGSLTVDGSVSVSNLPASQAVTGTFWQTTQPVSGTFWQATQPVSGSVSVSNLPVSQAVTGTFWQATQPVSGPLTDTQLRATPVPVSLASTTITGTAAVTQSGTWTVQPGNTQNTTPWLTKDSSDGTVASAVVTTANLQGSRAVADAASPTARTAGQLADNVSDLEGRLLVRTDHPRRVLCRLTTAATTSTVVTGCAAPGAGVSIYITDVSLYGGVATGATAAASIQNGTGGTCGTGTAVVYDCQHGATGGCEAHFVTPRKAAANAEVCVLDATVGTKFINISGYIAP